MKLILLGAPGTGKGTQAELLAQRSGACHLSTGDIFRFAQSQPAACLSPALAKGLEHMRRGELVPDETVLALIGERVECLRCPGGFLLDGFPRTVAQAQALQRLLSDNQVELDAVLSYQLPLRRVVARLGGRRSCPQCHAVFHVESRPPQREGVCDHCGSPLFQREDDRPESIRVRLRAYQTSTRPLTAFYRRRELLVPISADGAPEEIFNRTLEALSARQQTKRF